MILGQLFMVSLFVWVLMVTLLNYINIPFLFFRFPDNSKQHSSW